MKKTGTPFGAARLAQLDALRTLAVLLVICTHKKVSLVPWKIGWIGVDLFFVLSGYLISGLLFSEYQRTGGISVKRFLVRRGFKIYPSFYFFLLVSILLEILINSRIISWAELKAEIFFYQNYFARFWGHTWSLAVEELFYILLPLCLIILLLVRAKSADPMAVLPVLLACSVVIILLGRTYIAWRGFWVYSHTHTRVDALIGGVLVSYYWHFHHNFIISFGWRFRYIIALLIPFLITPVYFFEYDGFFISSIGLTMVWCGMAGLLLLLLILPVHRWLKYLARPGVYSYPVYLWHVPIAAWISFPDTILGFLAYVFVSFLVGFLMFNLLERPSLSLRDKLFPAIA